MSVLWVSELGSCHQGSKSLLYELIRKSVWAGSNLIKVQLGWTKEAQAKYCDSYDERRFIDPWVPDVDKWCKDFGVEWFASIWSMEGLEVARSVGMKRYKIAHQMNDTKLIAEMDRDGKETFWSGRKKGTAPSGYTEVYCQTEYPSYEFGYDGSRGYSSHMHGIADALIAVARGAEYIEKHITLDKTLPFPKDASFALLPEEFRQMVDIGSEIARIR